MLTEQLSDRIQFPALQQKIFNLNPIVAKKDAERMDNLTYDETMADIDPLKVNLPPYFLGPELLLTLLTLVKE
jgi:hypothetical protein